MIPVTLSVNGFLSYRQPADIDFTTFDVACIAGPNGAGKSSLLDAITWALFGQARKRDDSLINAQSSQAEVSLTFEYEGNLYRVMRAKPRGKTTVLEFHILQKDGGRETEDRRMASQTAPAAPSQNTTWKPLTERTLRDTEARIQSTLRLDYETFTNASFFLQGKADQFTQQRSGERKRVLGNILGLEIWETYRQRAAGRRRSVESEIAGLDGRLREIAVELAEEGERKQRLKELEADLVRLESARRDHEANLQNIRQIAATLEEQSKLVDTLARSLDAQVNRLEELQTRLDARGEERDSQSELISQSASIEAAYQEWQEKLQELRRLDEIAKQFREHEKRREAPRAEIQEARARLEQEAQTLRGRQSAVNTVEQEKASLCSQIESWEGEVNTAEERLSRKITLESELGTARQQQADAKAENPRLKSAMEELKDRIDQLSISDGAECPLCGQPLSESDRQGLLQRLSAEGAEMGDRYRANQKLLSQADELVNNLQTQISEFDRTESELRDNLQVLAGLRKQSENLTAQLDEWKRIGEPRLKEIELTLDEGAYAPEAHARLGEIDAELKQIGYDAALHDTVRQAEENGRASEVDMLTLEKARAALAPLEREIADLQTQVDLQREEIARQEEEHKDAAAALAAAQAQAPDIEEAERTLFDLQENENRLRLEVGAARQKVIVLDDLKNRQKELQANREELSEKVRQFEQLERAFGKDGVPALLIEQALPEIESKANEILARLSGGDMSVRFITQTEYKDKKREDLRETLDIQISDSAGTRDYEMFSGGEAFRVNFAIRLALSEVLAQRAGARLQTLVIDEGFGSQDALGRQRLIEAINLVRQDFAKILVITHIDELKDTFPNRIEVEKTALGSTAQVI